MNQMKLKGCDRCGGDLCPDQSDREAHTLVCLQCGSEVSTRTVTASHMAARRALLAQPVPVTIGS